MRPLNKNNKDILYLLQIVRHYFNIDSKPEFKEHILRNTSFFSLVKSSVAMAGIAFMVLKTYPQFQNTWLYNELQKYHDFYFNQDKRNNRIFKQIREIAKKENIDVLLLKENSYKTSGDYVIGERFSSDVDILIERKNIFNFDNILKQKCFLLKNSEFKLKFKVLLSGDGYMNISTDYEGSNRKEEIINGLKRGYRNFNYFKDGLLEVHFFPCKNEKEIDKKMLWDNKTQTKDENVFSVKPEATIVNNANHFFIHLTYNQKEPDGFRTFLGFLKRVVDLVYTVKSDNMNWNLVRELARKNNVSEQVYYYLFLGNKWLNLEIPNKIINYLKSDSSKSKIFSLHFLDSLSILKDECKLSTSFYAKMFIKNLRDSNRKTRSLSYGRKEKDFVIFLLRLFLRNKKYDEPLNGINYHKLLGLIKETAMDGVFYYLLKDNNFVDKEFLEELKKGYEAILLSDNIKKEAFDVIKKSNAKKVLFKESAHKLFGDYILGTRYSCDVDILIDESDACYMDEFLDENNFYSDDVEINIPKEIKDMSWKLNKNVSGNINYLNELRYLFRLHEFKHKNVVKDIDDLRKDMYNFMDNKKSLKKLYYNKSLMSVVGTLHKEAYSNAINRILKLELNKDKSVNYYYKNGAYVDIHTRLFNKNKLFCIYNNELKLIKIGKNLFKPSIEDSIIINACHFCLNILKYEKNYEFQGFLKYLLDLKYELKGRVNWDEIVEKSKLFNCSSQVWFYLMIAERYLKVKIPANVIDEIKMNGSRLQNKILGFINLDNLLFNEVSFGVKLYSKMYLEPGIISYVTDRAHRFFGK